MNPKTGESVKNEQEWLKTSMLFLWVPSLPRLSVCLCVESIYSALYGRWNQLVALSSELVTTHSKARGKLKLFELVIYCTVFCWINASAWINAPPTSDFTWLYLKTAKLIWITFSALNVDVFVRSPSQFHCSQTMRRVRFVPTRMVPLFGEIQYLFAHMTSDILQKAVQL